MVRLARPENKLYAYTGENKSLHLFLRNEANAVPADVDTAYIEFSVTDRQGGPLIARNTADDPSDLFVDDAATGHVVFWLRTADISVTLGVGVFLYSIRVTLSGETLMAVEPTELIIKPSGF